MEIKTLYRYGRKTGKITVSPIKPDCEYETLYRLIADEGKILTNGETEACCVDVESSDGWTEVEAPEEPEMDENEAYAEAGKILLGVDE
ncbi:MAG: hypothetical protein IKZ00_08180 [Bacteroidaceae bacterium]|nr:hypothetical protein [Bacteroidaceae bacterium]